ncbi:MAG: hypothetical protein JWN45_3169 [Acidobacteriaceae bacterium]|nr:hypothetical protein [Acidobacteriaceae bacterium]
MLVYLNGTDLPDNIYEEFDLATLEDQLIEVLKRDSLGELDGNETGPTETVLFLYGKDAEKMFSAIEPTLRDYPLCKGARVVLRQGSPGSPQREIRL